MGPQCVSLPLVLLVVKSVRFLMAHKLNKFRPRLLWNTDTTIVLVKTNSCGLCFQNGLHNTSKFPNIKTNPSEGL